MKLGSAKVIILSLVSVLLLAACAQPTATPVPKPTPTPVPGVATPTPSPLLKAKAEAEAKGYIFETSHDDIVAKAKKEGKLRVLTSLDPEGYPRMVELFKKRHPFITDSYVEEITGTEAEQRFLLELKSGTVKDWDIGRATEDFYNEYWDLVMKFDILGMAEQGVLSIDPRMVDPEYRTVVSVASALSSIAYNKKLLPPDKVPKTWEDFLKPEFKGRKFIVEIRPQGMAALAVGLGVEWVVDYARKLAAQEPVWARGQTRVLTSMAAGEYALHQLVNWHSCVRAAEKDPTGSLVCKLVEPVPVRLHEPVYVVKTAPHPYAALLWIETEVSTEGQDILDKYDPLKSSIYANGEVAKAIKGLKVSVNDFKTFHNTPRWTEMIVEAYGFPKAEVK